MIKPKQKIQYLAALLALLPIIMFSACKGDTLIDQQCTFDNNTWMRFEPQTIKIEVPSADNCYDIYLSCLIDTARFRGNALPMTLNLYSPDGERRMFRHDLMVRNKKGEWVGEWRDGLLLHERCVRQYFFFNSKGNYRLELAQCSHLYEMPGISTIGIRMIKSKLEYPK